MNKYDSNTMNYRKLHQRCRYCKYRKHVYKDLLFNPISWDECILKDKFINIKWPLRGRSCNWYVAKDVIED